MTEKERSALLAAIDTKDQPSRTDNAVEIEGFYQREHEQRVYDRVRATGVFNDKDAGESISFPIKDISSGGMLLGQRSQAWEVGTVVSGRIEIRSGDLRIGADVSCKVVSLRSETEAGVRFIDAPEAFLEVIRSLIFRTEHDSPYKGDWLPSAPRTQTTRLERNILSRLISGILRWEVLAGVLLLGLAALTFFRASDDQTFWMIENHEIISPVSGTIVDLKSDGTIGVDSVVARIAVDTISGRSVEKEITSPVTGAEVRWRYNIGDRVTGETLLGRIVSAPVNGAYVQAIVGLNSPWLSLHRGDPLVLDVGGSAPVSAEIDYVVTQAQAAIMTGVTSTTLNYESYYVLNVPVLQDLAFLGQVKVNHFQSLKAQIARVFRQDSE